MLHNKKYQVNNIFKKYKNNEEIPIWVLCSSWTFGDLTFIFNKLNKHIQYDVIRSFKYIDFKINEFIILMNAIRIIRNIIAHNNVLYNVSLSLFKSKNMESFIIRNNLNVEITENNRYGIYTFVLIIDKILNKQNSKTSLKNIIDELIENKIIKSNTIPQKSKKFILEIIGYPKNS